MKKIVVLVVLFLFSLVLSSCSLFKYDVDGSGEYSTVDYKLEFADSFEFDDLYVKYNSKSYLPTISMYPSTENVVQIYTDTAIHEHITVKVVDGKLKIYGDKNETYITEYFEVKIYGYTFEEIEISTAKVNSITYSLIDFSLSLSDASNCEPSIISCDIFNLELSGASYFSSGIAVANFDLELSGASNAELAGTASNLVAILSGASRVSAKNVFCSNVNVKLSGASDMSVTFTESLSGKLSGASSLTYNGSLDKVDVELSGASSIKQY